MTYCVDFGALIAQVWECQTENLNVSGLMLGYSEASEKLYINFYATPLLKGSHRWVEICSIAKV